MAGQLRVDQLTDSAGTSSPVFPNGVLASNLVFDNGTSLVSNPQLLQATNLYGGTFFQNSGTFSWNNQICVETPATISNNVTKYAFATGKKVIVTQVTGVERVLSSAASVTLSTTHTANYTVELYNGTSYVPIASFFSYYPSGTYQGGSGVYPRNTHHCIVGNPYQGGDVKWSNGLHYLPYTSVDQDHGFALTSNGILVRLRFSAAAGNSTNFQHSIRTAGTLERVTSDANYTGVNLVMQPTTTETRGFYNQKHSAITNTAQIGYTKFQIIPNAVNTNNVLNFSEVAGTSITTNGNFTWSFTAAITLACVG